MKKTICCLLLIATLFVSPLGTFAYEDDRANNTHGILSNMTNEECVSFLKESGVIFPYDEDDYALWGPIAKEMIAMVESNPAHFFAYNFTKTQELANQIKQVVNNYYGISPDEWVVPYAYTSNNQLLYSTLAGPWTEDYKLYNCYGYAIGSYYTFDDPGCYSGHDLLKIVSLTTIANYVKEDLEALGYNDVQTWSAEYDSSVCDICDKIALRIRPNVDYHFMRLDNGDSDWYHKPSDTALLKYLGNPITGIWTNEGYYAGTYLPPSIEYTSSTHFIGYNFHAYQYMYSGAGRHILTCVGCGATKGRASVCILHGEVCGLCGHDTAGNQLMSLQHE